MIRGQARGEVRTPKQEMSETMRSATTLFLKRILLSGDFSDDEDSRLNISTKNTTKSFTLLLIVKQADHKGHRIR